MIQKLKRGNSTISFEMKQGRVVARSIRFSGILKDLSYFMNKFCTIEIQKAKDELLFVNEKINDLTRAFYYGDIEEDIFDEQISSLKKEKADLIAILSKSNKLVHSAQLKECKINKIAHVGGLAAPECLSRQGYVVAPAIGNSL